MSFRFSHKLKQTFKRSVEGKLKCDISFKKQKNTTNRTNKEQMQQEQLRTHREWFNKHCVG